MKSYFAIYYTRNRHPVRNPLYSVTLEDAIQEASNELIPPYVSAEIVEAMRPGETVDRYNARVKEHAFIGN